MEQAFRGGHCHQHGNLACASALAEYGYIAGIAAETTYIVSHPFEARDNVKHARLPGRSVVRAPLLAELKKAKYTQPVVYRNDHNVSFAGEIATFTDGVSA